jgi:uncharacterized membrane protein
MRQARYIMQNSQNRERIWELDFFRGIALIMMIHFHIVFDMKEFFNYPVNYSSGINYYIGKTSAILFMLISGISCSLSRNNARRGLKVLGAAMIITLVTHLFNPGFGIKFGILHFFGVSMLLYPLLQRLNKYMLFVLGSIIIVLGGVVSEINVAFDYLFPFGIFSDSFISSDYYPLVPWFGVFVYGAFLGKLLYSEKRSLFSFSIGKNVVSMAGKRTLLVYIIHQPAIMLSLTLISHFSGR